MRWVTIIETADELRDRCVGLSLATAYEAKPEVVVTGVELARGETSVLVWIPVLVGKRIEPGGQMHTMPWRAGHVPVMEATLNIVRDATTEEIVAAGGKP